MSTLTPWLSSEHIQILKRAILSRVPVDVLEWGSGGSTVYFTEILRRSAVDYTWLSIEHDPEWYQTVISRIYGDQNTKVQLFPSNRPTPESLNMDHYVTYPRVCEGKYDIIIVDGRERARCLIEALFLLKDKGAVFLHDAERKRYETALQHYRKSHFYKPDEHGRMLWQGGLEE